MKEGAGAENCPQKKKKTLICVLDWAHFHLDIIQDAAYFWYLPLIYFCYLFVEDTVLTHNFSKWPTWRTIPLFCNAFITVL